MDQGPPAPLAQPAAATAPPVLPAPLPPPPVMPAAPAPPVFALGPGCSHAILDYDDGYSHQAVQQGHLSPRKEV